MNKHFLNKRLVHQLGFAGLVPFVLLTLASFVVSPEWLESFLNAQQVYAMVTLSFLGGIHWGATFVSSDLSAEQTKRTLLWGVAPVVIACIATVFGGYRFAVLMVGFIGSYQADKRIFAWYKFPDWFLRLRFILTCVVVVALMLTGIAWNARS